MHTFVWAVEKAGIDWSSEFAMEFMRRFNLTPSQFADMVQLFRSASTVDDQSAPRCDKCNFTALDEDGTLVRCSGTDCTKHRHQICGAYDGFKCEECIAADACIAEKTARAATQLPQQMGKNNAKHLLE